MNAEGTQALLEPAAEAIPARPLPVPERPYLERLRADKLRLAALQDTFRAFWVSRVLVLAAGLATVLMFGSGPTRRVLNPPGVLRGLGGIGDLLAAPVARWDSAWYLVIAHYGYRPDLGVFTAPRTAFFPLYPLGLRGISDLGVPPVLAGVLISLGALAAALYGVHRLTTLEFGGGAGREAARLAVLLLALSPMAFFFSAVYSESLYLALSVAVFWCARNGRWTLACLTGALATTTRSAGVLLAVPILYLYLYGPREDCAPTRVRTRWWHPRYCLSADVAWLALLPLGLALYMGYLGFSGESPLAPFHVQEVWGRHFAGPFGGAVDGARAAFDGVRQLLFAQHGRVYFAETVGDPTVAASHNVVSGAFLLAATVMLIGVLRRLPRAYGLYVLAALALPLSYPVSAQPLMSLPRFVVVLFPLPMWLALWLSEHPRLRLPTLMLSASLMMVFLGQFATWHWVA
ncbi:MAG TPA: mannosyltransferase family protein [Solirubrobacteraceae bacterium]|jgi:hypothetical protein